MGTTDTGVYRPSYSLRAIVTTAEQIGRLQLAPLAELVSLPFQIESIVAALGARTRHEFTLAAQRGPFQIDVDVTADEIVPSRVGVLAGAGVGGALPIELTEDVVEALRFTAEQQGVDVEDLVLRAFDECAARGAGAVAQELARLHEPRRRRIEGAPLAGEIECVWPSTGAEPCVTKFPMARCDRCNQFLQPPKA